MEKTIKVEEITEFKFGANKEKTGYKVKSYDGDVYTTFSQTDKEAIQKMGVDFPQEDVKLQYEETPAKDPAYPPNKKITNVADRDGNFPVKQSRGGGGYSPKVDNTPSIERQVAMKGAIELCVHERIEIKELSVYADKIISWIQKDK